MLDKTFSQIKKNTLGWDKHLNYFPLTFDMCRSACVKS